ncbi:ComEC/Rec2 family competence protein [Massilia eburnea]|nr:MBL fold metallo-hydrolase [Massilia eburnea]
MSKKIFRMHSLYAGHGDCLWLEYGLEANPHRIVVDCGTIGTAKRVKEALDIVRNEPGSNELLVITHVDADHIGGAISVLEDPKYGGMFKEIWFNGRRHLEPADVLEHFGAVQGERVTDALLEHNLPWNSLYAASQISLSEDGTPKEIKLPGDAKLTILSPSWEKLRAMIGRWDREIEKAGLLPNLDQVAPQPIPEGFETFGFDVDALADEAFEEDTEVPNGSSIAFIVEFDGKSILLGADAHPTVLINAIQKKYGKLGIEIDVLKLPHHGSKHNVSQELLEAVKCKTAVFSSNGAYFKHPDREAVARVVKHSPEGVELVFNCRSDFNKMWDSDHLRDEWKYKTRYGVREDGVSVILK